MSISTAVEFAKKVLETWPYEALPTGGVEGCERPYEKVDHPKHYNLHPAGIECIDVIEEMSFNLGNAVKYIWRAGLKPDSKSDEDLAEAEWYLKRERERLAKRTK